ncbi:HU family DNA-binding protein [Thermosulfurimonas dismutans]|uniref:Exopolyphosphatase n=1 Tax=Thermosulfurimonas dismutans TaxID=999894 RepID=A0A179D1J6_9BACT|nr:HU family DNA-binding protein [Thermosulfurimonas dismutans]OAQ19945.1 Exopolyphosphatase [Thermosulfurimonas dismutans]
MKRHELIERLTAHFPELRKRDLESLVEATFEEISRFLKDGGRIEFRDFGRFEVHHGKERIFVNPKNGETYYLPGNQRLVFKVGKDLKERLNTPPLAALDLGTQTFRLALGKKEEGGLRVIARYRENVRLGEGLAKSDEISVEAWRRGISALKNFYQILDTLEVSHYRAIGTAVFRRAKNISKFIQEAKGLGIKIEVISPEEEAWLVVKGVMAGLKLQSERFLLVDAGGGSTEIVFIENGKKIWETSLPLGVVTLKDHLIKTYPLTREEYRSLRSHIGKVLSEVEWPKNIDLVVGCGGSASLLGALDLKLAKYVPERLHGHKISQKKIESLGEYLWGLSLSKIRRLRGMESGREDIALPGILIYSEILRKTNQSHLVISEWGLLEGLLLSL